MIRTLCALIACIYATSIIACNAPVDKTLDKIKADPVKLHEFVRNLPKGGDLHTHLDGAVYAEKIIQAGRGSGFCVEKQSFVAKKTDHCDNMFNFTQIQENRKLYEKTVEAWSMKHFDKMDGHDYFFDTFGKFVDLVHANRPIALADVVQRASDNNVMYLELMDTLDNNASAIVGSHAKYSTDFDKLYDELITLKLFDLIKPTEKQIDTILGGLDKELHCGRIPANKACRLPINFLYQVLREQAPQEVFASLLFGFKLAETNPHVVGLNMVQPEDGPISLRDYRLHMHMIYFLKGKFPNVPIALHAGELTTKLVKPADLKFHMNDAIRVAGSRRIGHGVSITEETNYQELLKIMKQKEILIEINLSSNDQILGIKGKEHPLNLYLNHEVPVALSTDDEGILRTNISHEYERAILEHHLDYCTLKNMSRNALTFSFIPGDSLWKKGELNHSCNNKQINKNRPSRTCRKFLQQSTKARLQWRLERAFKEFEMRYSS